MVDIEAVFGLISAADYAAMRGVETTTLANERSRGDGPPFVKVGNKTFYSVKALRTYMQAHTIKPVPRPTIIDGTGRRHAVAKHPNQRRKSASGRKREPVEARAESAEA